MNGFVDFTFAWFWHYTKLTFRIFFWLFRWIIVGISALLNRRQAAPSRNQSDLFDNSKR